MRFTAESQLLQLITTSAIIIVSVGCSAVLMINNIEQIVLVHGGAGDISKSSIPGKIQGVKLAARKGYVALQKSGNVLDAVEEAVRSMELDAHFNAGYGAVLTFDRTVEADAAIMNGANLNAGCVSIVQNILHPIELARHVMEKTRHKYLAGEGVMRFAKNEGFDILPEGSLVTAAAQKALEDYKNSLNITSKFDLFNNKSREFGEPGTVGAVAIDAYGNVAAATSTGGITGKLPGRIGDSSILGAGTYADNSVGAISATGHGETIMRYNVASRILALMELNGMTGQTAAEIVLESMTQRFNETAGIIGIDAFGSVGIHFTSSRMSWSYQRGDKLHFGINRGDDFVEEITETF